MIRSYARLPSAVVSMALITFAGAACSKTSSSPSAAAPAQSCSPPDPSQSSGTSTTSSIENATTFAFTNSALSQPTAQCGQCVIAAEQNGAAVPLLGDHPLTLTSSSTTGSFFSDASCATAITSLDLALGASSGTFYYTDSAAGAPTLTATDTNSAPLTAATQAETIFAGSALSTGTGTATSTTGTGSTTVTTTTGTTGVTTSTGAASGLAFTAASTTLTRNTCNQVTITLSNASGSAVVATSLVEMLLTTSTQTGSYFNDSNCRQQIAIALITPGFSSVSAFYAEGSQGSVTLAATPAVTDGLTGAIANFIFQ